VHAIWVNVDEPEIEEGGHYYSNDAEIEAIHSILTLLINAETFKTYQDFFKTQSEENQEIGIITFYGPQMKKIGQKLYPSLKPNDWREFDLHKFKNEFKIPFRINTVDKFQGMEKNIVIISTVRSDRKIKIDPQGNKKLEPNRSLGFAKELTRINVGFSRAKRLLIVVGNEKHFSHKPEYQQAIQKMHRIDIAQIQNLIK
jgi:superfamily I DNA and/or RNA helicase